jgi:hypothetical protein
MRKSKTHTGCIDALKSQIRYWENLPCGVDYDADPNDRSPEDHIAHIGGLAIQEARRIIAELEKL